MTTKEDAVLTYIKRRPKYKSALIFSFPYYVKDINSFIKSAEINLGELEQGAHKDKTTDDMVLFIIKYSRVLDSKNLSTGKIETSRGRHRSSFDIWRHIKYFREDITLFDVMRSIYKLFKERKIGADYCYTVRRIVTWFGNSYQWDIGSTEYIIPKTVQRLQFRDWEHIGEEINNVPSDVGE